MSKLPKLKKLFACWLLLSEDWVLIEDWILKEGKALLLKRLEEEPPNEPPDAEPPDEEVDEVAVEEPKYE